MNGRKLRFKVHRRDPEAGEAEGRFEEYVIPWWEGMKVLDALRHVQEEVDHSLAVRWSCRVEDCRTCQMRVNGKSVLSCQVPAEDGMVIEPVPRYRLIRDLVVEFGERMNASEYARNEFDD
ncbi:MAG: (2Fe-2S)-binding protein [Candidatus Tectomicrobia bacterium]|nr:(2Fe-2S)-binding protein [Candidatus Tectomicrobia bacterium]